MNNNHQHPQNYAIPVLMTKKELIAGLFFLPVHVFVLPVLISMFYEYMLPVTNLGLTEADLNLVYYVFSFLASLVLFWRFLKSSFHHLIDNFFRSVRWVIGGYLIYYLLIIGLSYTLFRAFESIPNPNNDQVFRMLDQKFNFVVAMTVVLGPLVEECLFRGVIFGGLRKKSRFFAYAVSAAAFCGYHLWQYFAFAYDPALFLSLIAYIPPAIVLAYCYEKAGNIWAPAFLHMIINGLVLTAYSSM